MTDHIFARTVACVWCRSLRAGVSDDMARMLEQHDADRAEIQRLNEVLYERNNATIQDLKGVLDRIPLKEGAGQTPNDEVPRLKEALERANVSPANIIPVSICYRRI